MSGQPTGGRRGTQINRERYGFFFTVPYLVVYVVFGVFPIIFTLVVSFTNWNGIDPVRFVGLTNYAALFTERSYFWMSIRNTTLIMLMSIPIGLILGLVLAYLLFSPLLKLRNIYRVSILLPYIITPIAIGMLFMTLFDLQIGAVNNLLLRLGIVKEAVYWLGYPNSSRFVVALAIVWKYLGYYMVMFLAGFTNIPIDIVEAARIDGANDRNVFFRIAVPMIRPVLAFLVITSIIGGFQLLEEPMMIFRSLGGAISTVGGPRRAGLTVIWNIYDTAFQSKLDYGLASAMSYGLFVIIAICSFFVFRLVSRREEN